MTGERISLLRVESEEDKQQFRYHFGQLWNLIKDPFIRQHGLCSDSGIKFDYTKTWDEIPIEIQDKLILESVWRFSWSDLLCPAINNKTPKESSE